ncbi:unnamed protein product [Urochloa humidicola]
MPKFQKTNGAPAVSSNVIRRNRASPSRIVKLYKHLSDSQCKMIEDVHFGGLLKISCATIPADYANWLLVDCFDAETSQLVLPGRGRISLTADSVNKILGLPSNGAEVKYELDVEAINFMHEKYDLHQGIAPKIEAIVKRIKGNKEADGDFLRSFLMLAVSTFLCPPTSLGISARCYPSLVDLTRVKDLNWAQFVVDQFKLCATKMGKKDSVRVCLLLLVVLYVDSLDAGNLQIPNTEPRVAAWSRKLIEEVIKLDTNRDGSFGKLKLKRSAYCTVQDTFFAFNDIDAFVSSKAPRSISVQKKRKICAAVSKVLSGMTDLLGTFVQEISAVESEHESETEPPTGEPSMRRTEAEPSTKRSKRQYNEGVNEEQGKSAAAYEEKTLGSDYEEEEEEYEDYISDDDSQESEDSDEVEEDMPDESARHRGCSDTWSDLPPRSPGTTEEMHLDPITEVNEEGTDARDQSNAEVDDEDNVPLAVRMRRMKEAIKQPSECQFEPIPLEVCPPAAPPASSPAAPPADIFKNRRARLRLPEVDQGCSEKAVKSADILPQSSDKSGKPADSLPQSLNFTPPECNIMKFVDSSQANQNGTLGENSNSYNGSGSVCPLDLLDEEILSKIEEEAIQEINMRKLNSVTATSKSPQIPASAPTITPPIAATSFSPLATDIDPASANSSVTPAYQPHPRRQTRKAAALRSPFVDIQATSFKCNKVVCDVYNVVLAMDRKGL